MSSNRVRLVQWLLVSIPALGGLAWAYSYGPEALLTGAPPDEGTCANPTCHNLFPLNSGSGSFSISAPAQYTPGDTLDLSIHLQQTGQKRWGFELTVIDAAGDPVGTILVSEPLRTKVGTDAGGRQYLTQLLAGTDSGTVDSSPGWTFRWKAPAAGAGTATFYAAGNAANGDGAVSGDYVYTTLQAVTEGVASVHETGGAVPRSWYIEANAPNPFNAGTRIRYVLDATAAGSVSLVVRDINGRTVRRLPSTRYVAAGEHWVDWDGRDEHGASAPSGTYLLELNTRAGADTRKVTLLR